MANTYFKFLGIEEDTTNLISEQNNEQPAEEIELNEITDDALEKVSLEIDDMTNTVDDSLSVMSDLETQTITNEKLLNDNDTEITEENVMSSQESYYIALGRLGYSKDTVERISVEQYSTNRERLTVSNEGITEFIKTLFQKLKDFLKYISNAISKFFKMIKDFIFGKTKEREETIKIIKDTKNEPVQFNESEINKVREMLGYFVIFEKPIINNNNFAKDNEKISSMFANAIQNIATEVRQYLKDAENDKLNILLTLTFVKTLNNSLEKLSFNSSYFNNKLASMVSRLNDKNDENLGNNKNVSTFLSLHKNEIKVFSFEHFDETGAGGNIEVTNAPYNQEVLESIFSKSIDGNVNVLFDKQGNVKKDAIIKAHLHVKDVVNTLNITEKSVSNISVYFDKLEKELTNIISNSPNLNKENSDVNKLVSMLNKYNSGLIRIASDTLKGYGEYVLAMNKMLDYIYNKYVKKVKE